MTVYPFITGYTDEEIIQIHNFIAQSNPIKIDINNVALSKGRKSGKTNLVVNAFSDLLN